MMEKTKRMINENLERLPFETILREVFAKYRDNMMCSSETVENITQDAALKIREQLRGMSRDGS
jgi:hypothetical protein